MIVRRQRHKKATEFVPIMRLWLLRLLVPIGAQRQFISHVGFNDDSTAELLGLQEWVGVEAREFDLKLVRAALRKLHESAEVKLQNAAVPECLRDNIARIAKLVNLSETDCRILEFAVMVRCEPTLENMSGELGSLSKVRVFQTLSMLLDIAEHEIRAALSTQGILAKSGLVSLEGKSTTSLNDALELLSDTFADNIYTSAAARAKSGRLCLYGPPGTGKTAYGRWLAEQLDMPLLVKRASDLMSMYVGQNEKNIALAFNEAANDGALLLIDEVDGFLQDRKGAQRGWEVSLVNEMLAQMESFPGVLIASTNLMEGLDTAGLRRLGRWLPVLLQS